MATPVIPVTQVAKTKEQAEKDIAQGFDINSIINNTSKNKDNRTTGRTLTQLNKVSGRALLEQTAREIQYNVKFSDVDIQDFLRKFAAEQKSAEVKISIFTVFLIFSLNSDVMP